MEKVITICGPTNLTGTTGSDGYCAECNEKVWVSDSTIEAVQETLNNPLIGRNDISPLCLNCGFKMIAKTKKEGEKVSIAVGTKQIEEIKDAIVKKLNFQKKYN